MNSSATPVTNRHTGRILGWIVRYDDGTSMFVQSNRVRPGSLVNYGVMARYIPWYLVHSRYSQVPIPQKGIAG